MPINLFSSQHKPLQRVFSSDILVTSGLICHLKTAPSSGSTWTDEIGNSNASLGNSPTYSSNNGGYVTLNGTNQYILTSTALTGQFSGTSPNKSNATSIFIWCYPLEQGVIISELGISSLASGWHDSNIEILSTGVICFSVWHNSLASKVSSTAKSFNNWYYLGWTYSGTTLTAYINGVSVGTASLTRAAPYNSGYNLFYALGAADSTNMGDGTYCNMRVGSFQVYNRGLTASEVARNYNSNKSRYGL